MGQRLEADTAMTRRRADDPELQLTFGHEVDHRLGVVHLESDADAWALLLELAEELGHDDRRRPGRRSERERACELAVLLGRDVVEELLLELKHALGAAIQPPARFGGLDAPARAVEELQAEALLERPHLQRDGRLGDAEPLRRLRERPALDHRAERLQLARIHKHLLSHGAV